MDALNLKFKEFLKDITKMVFLMVSKILYSITIDAYKE